LDRDSYSPLQNGIRRDVAQKVAYHEYSPRPDMAHVVHCFWSLKTTEPLANDFIYTVLPDACIDIVFDTTGHAEPIIMTPKVEVEPLDLGKQFSYIGIRFKPGTFSEPVDVRNIVGNQRDLNHVIGAYVNLPRITPSQDEQEQFASLELVAQKMIEAKIVQRNLLIEHVVQGLQQGLSVEAIAKKSGWSTRQLRRKVAQQTGYSPMQLRRILRFQSALSSGDPLLRFADQSHLIKEFKAVTGISYGAFLASFVDGRKVQS
jgi:AraC-like DNA-binding protein